VVSNENTGVRSFNIKIINIIIFDFYFGSGFNFEEIEDFLGGFFDKFGYVFGHEWLFLNNFNFSR